MSLSLTFRPTTEVILQSKLQTSQEGRNRDVSDGELADGEALRRQERLDSLEGVDQHLGVCGAAEHLELGGTVLVGEGVDEQARFGAEDRILGENAGLGEEVCDELDEDEGFGQLDGFGRRLVGRNIWSTVGNGWDLGERAMSEFYVHVGQSCSYIPC